MSAAMPSLSGAMTSAVVFAVFAIFGAGALSALAPERLSPTRRFVLFVATAVVLVAIVVAVAVMLHHAAWTDYRRQR